MNISVTDDFDLRKIIASGQCFRAREIGGGVFRFITGAEVLYIQKTGEGRYDVSCDRRRWNAIWAPYFSLDIDYGEIRKKARGRHPFIDAAMDEGAGLRVLRQDPWEMLVTFIISQRKSIPAIAKAVDLLAGKYGDPIASPYGRINTFPSPLRLRELSGEELSRCSLGYRTSYVLDAIARVSSGEIQLEALKSLSDELLCQRLMEIRGVGRKVANCVCLFGYGRTGMVPVDVWIQRVIDEEFSGQNLFEDFGSAAGIIQQYVFYCRKSRQRS